MFRSSTIIRELALNLAKVIFMLKLSVKLRRYLLCGCVAACCKFYLLIKIVFDSVQLLFVKKDEDLNSKILPEFHLKTISVCLHCKSLWAT